MSSIRQNSDSPHILRLRLAARTLIEWRAGPENETYRRVLQDFAAIHPAASVLALNKDLLSLDTEGTLLWYLSEPFVGNSFDSKRETATIDDIFMACMKTLLELGIMSRAKRKLWRGGPDGSSFVDAVFEGIRSKKKAIKTQSYELLICLFLRMDATIMSRKMNELRQQIGSVSDEVKRTRNRISAGSQVLMWSLSTAMAFVAAASINNWIFKSTQLQFIFAATFTLSIRVIFESDKSLRVRIKRLLLKRTAFLDDLIEVSNDETSIAYFQDAMLSIFGKLEGALAQVLKIDSVSENNWIEVICRLTKIVQPQIAQDILRVLRSPETNPAQRATLFEWVCGVHIYSSPKRISRKRKKPK